MCGSENRTIQQNVKQIQEEILLRYCRNECNEAERLQVEEACESSEELRRNVNDLRLSLEIADNIREIEAIDVAGSYRKTQLKIRDERRRRHRLRLTQYAALLAIPLLCSTLLLGYFQLRQPHRPVNMVEVNTPAGTVTRYELPDGSIAWLNAGSRIKYPDRFDAAKREVTLSGEAYFDVKADEKHPFYVHTEGGLTIYVYGTRFNVNAYEEENHIETVLEEGKVNVITPAQEAVIRMQPGQALIYCKDDKAVKRKEADIYEKTAWKEGKLIFRNTPIEEVLKRLSRHFNVEIEFENLSGEPYNYRATFHHESLPQILNYLSRSAPLEWKIKEGVQQADNTFTRKQYIVRLY